MAHGFIPVPHAARIELIYGYNGVTCENVLNVQKGSDYTLAQLQALRGTVDTWHSATGKQINSTGCILNRIRTKALHDAAAPTEDYTLPTPRAGTQAGTQMPANVTWCVKLATGLSGRNNRGRYYCIGLTSGFLGLTANQIGAAAAANIVTWLNALQTALAGAGHTLGVVSYYHLGWRTTGQFTASTGFVAVDLNLDSMRRRLTGRGSA